MADDNPTAPEAWKDIPEFGGYQVSDLGRVRSFWRRGEPNRTPEFFLAVPRLMKLRLSDRGYLVLRLVRNDGKARCQQVHRLVLSVFVGPCPPGHEGCHKDGIRTNNRLDNLYWGTRSQNCLDTARHGRNRNSVLAPDDVEEAIRLYRSGMKKRQIAERFGVDSSSLSSLLIVRGLRDARPRFSPEETDEVLRLRAGGMSQRDIANRFQSTQSTISHLISRAKSSR